MCGEPQVMDRGQAESGRDDEGSGKRQSRRRRKREPVTGDERPRERPRWPEPHPQRVAQTRVKIRVPFVPPKPNELDSAARMGISRAVCGT